VVLEDDVLLFGGFLEAARAATDAILAEPNEVEFVQLYVMPQQLLMVRPKAWTPRRHHPLVPCHSLVPKPDYSWGLHAYAVSPVGAAKILASTWPMLGAADEQIPRLSGVGMHVLFHDDPWAPDVLREDGNAAPSVTNAAPRTVAAVLAGG
jgi:hypothetical protein